MINSDEEIRRTLAEKIMLGEYSGAVVSLMNSDGTCANYTDGSVILCLGMAEAIRQDLLRKINAPADED